MSRPEPAGRGDGALVYLPIPEEWEQRAAVWPECRVPDGVTEAVEKARAEGLMDDLKSTEPFLADLYAALRGPACCVMVTHQNPAQVVAAVSLLGVTLGDVTYPASPTLGGPASVVPTGGVDRYEQAWHTDSTPWIVPNRWSVLGLLHEDPQLPGAPTGILPWHLLERAWRTDESVIAQLREIDLPWRDQYPSLPQLRVPIWRDVPRWFRPALAPVIDRPEGRLRAACAVDEALKRTRACYEAVVAPGRLLVFDNYAVLHRGPAVCDPSDRTLLRLKVDGVPER